MHYGFIINPKSGMNFIQKNVHKVIGRLTSEGHEVSIENTSSDGDAQLAVARLSGVDLLVAVGGDGTINEVVNGIMALRERMPLAIVPAGTVNDFANYFKLPSKEQGIYDYLTRFESTYVDIGQANDRYFTNVVAAGFISDVGYKVQQKTKKIWGRFAYYREGAIEAIKYMKRANTFKFVIGDNEVQLDAYMFLALNTTHLGGLSYFAPQASCDDGFIDLFIIKKTGLIGGFILLIEILMGKHIDDENIIYFKVKSFEVSCKQVLTVDIDGERGENLPQKIKVLKQHFNLAIPKRD